MKQHYILFALILIFLENISAQKNLQLIQVDHYKTKKFDIVIFPANSLDLIPGIRFTPTRQEIDSAESTLHIELKNLNKPLVNQSATPIIHKKLNKYKRQYFGYIDQNGDKILLINCFWAKDNDLEDSWLKSMVMVLDGGSYYWQIKFNISKRLLFDLKINGYALLIENKNKRHLTCRQPQQNSHIVS